MNSPASGRTAEAVRRAIFSPFVWCVFATTTFVLTTNVQPLLHNFGDPDDAVRLISVREFLHGAAWFDTTLPRIGAPTPLVSHWSRLIDAPLSLLIGGLTPALGSESAELITVIVWPALLLFALQLVLVREARRRGGARCAALALILAMTSITAIVQFSPGRIDHHNAMILFTVGGLLALERSFAGQRAGWAAGVSLGIALAIGYEPIALILPSLGVAAIIGIWTGYTNAAARALTAAAATMALALLATVRWTQWMPIHCDALAINVPASLACCAAGLWFASAPRYGRIVRATIAAISAGVALAVFAALEPACLRGPFAQVSPDIRRMWLDSVMETKSVLAILESNAPLGGSFIVFAGLGACAQVEQARRRADAASVLAAATMGLACILGCWQLKLMPYASWLAAMSLAVAMARLDASRRFSAPHIRVTAAILASQATWMIALIALRGAGHGTGGRIVATEPAIVAGCREKRSFTPLARLAPGLVAADLDLGPYIVAATRHRVVAAPYHRLAEGIPANQAILTGPADRAAQEIRRLGVTYIAVCQADAGRRHVIEATSPHSLEAKLLRSEPVDFLKEETNVTEPIRIWSVRP